MSFFNEIGKKTTEATNKITKETKLRFKMGDLKGKVNNLYQEIGKKVYEKHAREDNIDISEELKEECEKIDELSKDIEEARLEILKLNNKRLCPNCFSEVQKDAAFCSKCGEKLAEEEVVTDVPENIQEAEETAEKVEEEKNEENNTENE